MAWGAPRPPPPWWNQWWYDDPYKAGAKWVQLVFDWQAIDPLLPVGINVTINWTGGLWQTVLGHENGPPIPGQGYDPELYIQRLTPWSLFGPDPGPVDPPWAIPGHFDSGKFWLPTDYNPEWVSVDVRGVNVGISNGVLAHECVAEPATTVLLLGFGLAALTGLKRIFA